MAKTNNKNDLIYIPIIYVGYTLLSIGLTWGFDEIYYKYWVEKVLLDIESGQIYLMSIISILIAGGLYLRDNKSNFYELLPLVFLVVATIQLLKDWIQHSPII